MSDTSELLMRKSHYWSSASEVFAPVFRATENRCFFVKKPFVAPALTILLIGGLTLGAD